MFVFGFFEVIAASAPHIYDSALFLSPVQSLIRKVYDDHLPKDRYSCNAIENGWNVGIRATDVENTNSLVFSHSGDLLAACQNDSQIAIVEPTTGLRRFTLRGHPQVASVLCASFSPDDSGLVSGSDDGTVIMWDMQTGGIIRTFKCETKGAVRSVNWSTIRTSALIGDAMWHVHPGEVSIHDNKEVGLPLSWSPAQERLAYLPRCQDSRIDIWDLNTKSKHSFECAVTVSAQHKFGAAPGLFAHSPDGSEVALALSGSYGSSVVIQEVEKEDIFYGFKAEPKIIWVSFFGTNKDKIVYTDSSSIYVYDRIKRALVSKVATGRISDKFAITSDGAFVACGGYGRMSIVSTNGANTSPEVQNDASGSISALAFAPSGTFLLSASPTSESGDRDSYIKLWDPETGVCLHTSSMGTSSITLVSISPDSMLVALAFQFEQKITIWSVADKVVIRTLFRDLNMGSAQPRELVFSHNSRIVGSYLASRVGGAIRLWDVDTAMILAQVPGYIQGLAFSPDDTEISVKISYATNGAEKQCWRMVQRSKSSTLHRGTDDLPFALDPLPSSPRSKTSSEIPEAYRIDETKKWILDREGSHVCWLPPHLNGLRHTTNTCYGTKLIIGTVRGKVFWFDFGRT